MDEIVAQLHVTQKEYNVLRHIVRVFAQRQISEPTSEFKTIVLDLKQSFEEEFL